MLQGMTLIGFCNIKVSWFSSSCKSQWPSHIHFPLVDWASIHWGILGHAQKVIFKTVQYLVRVVGMAYPVKKNSDLGCELHKIATKFHQCWVIELLLVGKVRAFSCKSQLQCTELAMFESTGGKEAPLTLLV